MPRPARTGDRARSRRLTRGLGFRGARRRGVSDVVATILLLALTVTLFASIFAFVGAFPQPTPQAQNEFQATLIASANGSYITGLTITHLAGPVLPPSDHILLSTSRVQSAWQFNIGGQGIPVSWGLGNTSGGWSLGQVWTTTFTKLVKVPDNITVYVVSPTQLLYSATLPALVQNIPPAIQTVGTTPASPTVGQAFQIWATLAGNITGVTVTVNLGGIPGLSGTKTMTNVSYVWEYNNTAATSTAGTYYAFVTVSSPSGQTVSQSVPVVIASSGGGSSASLSVTAGVSPQPFSVPSAGPGTNMYPSAVVTYSGSKSGMFYANFTVVAAQGGKAATANIVKTTISSATGIPIAGPTSVTDYSQTPFVTWLNTTITVYANVSFPGVGTATGTATFGPYNLVIGYVYYTTIAGSTSRNTSTASHSCMGSGCPYLDLTIKNNYLTSTYNGPMSLSYVGSISLTCKTGGGSSCTTPSTSYTINSTVAGAPIAQNSFVTLSYNDTTTLTGHWVIPPNDNVRSNVFTTTLTLTITSGSTTVVYIWEQTILTLT